jgi:hypothetical protein
MASNVVRLLKSPKSLRDLVKGGWVEANKKGILTKKFFLKRI